MEQSSTFNYITTEEQMTAALQRLSAKELALDSETGVNPEWEYCGEDARLCPHRGHICLLTLQANHQPAEIFDFIHLKQTTELTQLYNFLEDKLLIAHFAQFDGKMLMGEFKRNSLHWWCTLQADKLLSNATGSKFGMLRGHSLNSCTRDYLGIPLKGKGTLQRDNWDLDLNSRTLDNPHWVQMLKYATADTQYLHNLKAFIEPILINPLPSQWMNQHSQPDSECGFDMADIVQLEMDMVNVMIEMEYFGFPVSSELIKMFQEANEYAILDYACDLADLLDIPLTDDPVLGEVPTEKTLKTFNNPKKVTELLNQRRVIVGDAQKSTLMRMLSLMEQVNQEESPDITWINEDEEERYKELLNFERSLLVQGSEILKTLLAYKRTQKQKGMSMLPFVNPATGCIHPSVKGPVSTGRMAMGKPNLQQISNNTDYILELEVIDGSVQHYSDSAFR